jgi:hypothetical protein
MHQYEISPDVAQEQLCEFSLAEQDVKERYHHGQINYENMRQVERRLVIVQKQFKSDRVDLLKQLQQAREGIGKARIKLHKQRASLTYPQGAAATRGVPCSLCSFRPYCASSRFGDQSV